MKNDIKDIFNDPEYSTLRKIAHRLPEFVKKDNTDTYDVIPLKSWAYIEKTADGSYNKYFPIHNAAHAIMSYEYLKENRDSMEKSAYRDAEKKILNAIDAFGVKKYASEERIDLTDETIEESPTIGMEAKDWKMFILDGVDVADPATVNLAINKFRLYNSYMLPGDRFYTAKEILKAADAANLRITRGSLLYRYKLIDEMRLNKVASDIIKIRFKYYDNDVRKIAKVLVDNMENLNGIEVAEKVYDMDKMAGVTDQYNKGLPDPYLYIMGKKRFSKKDVNISDHVMKKLSSVFNDEFVERVKKNPKEAYDSLGQYGQMQFRDVVRDFKE